MTSAFIEPNRFTYLELFCDIPEGTLKGIAPHGEFLMNFCNRLPDDQARRLEARFDEDREYRESRKDRDAALGKTQE